MEGLFFFKLGVSFVGHRNASHRSLDEAFAHFAYLRACRL